MKQRNVENPWNIWATVQYARKLFAWNENVFEILVIGICKGLETGKGVSRTLSITLALSPVRQN